MHINSTPHRHYMSMYKLPILPFVFRQNDECALHILIFLSIKHKIYKKTNDFTKKGATKCLYSLKTPCFFGHSVQFFGIFYKTARKAKRKTAPRISRGGFLGFH